MDNVQNTRRLALMNCYLHELEATIFYGDSIGEGRHVGLRHDVILTNPPFGKGVSGAPFRGDFLYSTSNKQLNFVQHCMTILKNRGEAAVVVPDNVLFDRYGRGVREHLVKTCNLHTILRLPEGTFNPYSSGVKANVIFFNKGTPTKETWFYDLRTNIENINKGNPLTEKLFDDFEKRYNERPRKESSRFRAYTRQDIEKREYSLDIFWLRHDNIDTDLSNPHKLAEEIAKNLESALNSINQIKLELGENGTQQLKH